MNQPRQAGPSDLRRHADQHAVTALLSDEEELGADGGDPLPVDGCVGHRVRRVALAEFTSMRITTCGEALARAQRFAPSQVMLRRETGKSAALSSTSGPALLFTRSSCCTPVSAIVEAIAALESYGDIRQFTALV